MVEELKIELFMIHLYRQWLDLFKRRIGFRGAIIFSICLVNLFVAIASPSLYEPPPLVAQHGKVICCLIISLLPLLWTLALLLLNRGRFVIVCALVNLIPASVWLATNLSLTLKAFNP
jgi:hypothetical protein